MHWPAASSMKNRGTPTTISNITYRSMNAPGGAVGEKGGRKIREYQENPVLEDRERERYRVVHTGSVIRCYTILDYLFLWVPLFGYCSKVLPTVKV